MGYATSAQALEMLAQDTKEAYVQRARILRSSQKYTAAIEVIGTLSAAGNAVGFARSPNVFSGVMTAATVYYLSRIIRAKPVVREATEGIERIANNWANREEHPIRMVGRGMYMSRYIPQHLESQAKALRAYDTMEQLQAQTTKDTIGLVNGVTVQQAQIPFVAQSGSTLVIGTASALHLTEIGKTVPGRFRVEGKALVIAHQTDSDICIHQVLPAVETDDYYNWRDARKLSKSAKKLLAWIPAPARA